MIDHRPFAQLGRFDNDWLNARYHFSFSGYRDPARMQWGALRVWNDDMIKAKSGFAPHSHSDMEIITYVRTGAISHEDSLGNKGRTAAGDVQVMSAGAGVTHAEYNLEDEATTLYQIWILPRERGGAPFWGAAQFPKEDRTGSFVALASGFADDQGAGALPIRADARLMAASITAGERLFYTPAPGRRIYVAAPVGAIGVNDVRLNARDGAAIKDEARLTFTAHDNSDIVLVDTV